jgi:hypothetical protein
MFDFQKSVRRHYSMHVSFHDEFSGDRDLYLLRDNDILVTSGGGRIAGLNHSSKSRQPVQRFLVSAFGGTAAQRIHADYPPLNGGFAKRDDARGIKIALR